MNISRPTLARIIKSARKKIASDLINDSNIKIHEIKNDFHIALCSNNEESINDISIDSKYIFILHIKYYQKNAFKIPHIKRS